MTNNTNDKLASDFQVLPGEATFPPPITRELIGGAHIAPECITRSGRRFVMIEWPNGLPRHDSERTVRFPHGLMMFGETIDQCAKRLVQKQLGMQIDRVRVLHIDSYIDEQRHWHIEPWLLVDVSGQANLPAEASKVVYFNGTDLPHGSLWTKESFQDCLSSLIEPITKLDKS